MSTFALNFMKLLEIDTTPQGASRTYKRIGAGISSAVPTNNENIAKDGYIDGNGYMSTDAIGAQRIWTCSGHRDTDDLAQNYIAGLQSSLGDDRKTNFREYDADGFMRSGSVTVCNIEEGAGDALGKSEFGFEIHYNGKPSETEPTTAPTASVEIDTGSATGTTRFSLKKSVATDDVMYRLRGSTAGTIYASQYVSGLLDYTEGTLQTITQEFTHAAEADTTFTLKIDAACLTGGTDTITVTVATGDTVAQVAEKAIQAIAAESGAGAAGGEFYATRSGATYTLTAKSAAANDDTYAITFTAGTSGVTAGAAAAGSAGVVNADINAAAGQYLQCFEVDANDRIVGFYEKALVSGDIKS